MQGLKGCVMRSNAGLVARLCLVERGYCLALYMYGVRLNGVWGGETNALVILWCIRSLHRYLKGDGILAGLCVILRVLVVRDHPLLSSFNTVTLHDNLPSSRSS